MQSIKEKLSGMGCELPSTPQAVGSYLPALTLDRVVYVSGQISKDRSGQLITGRVGKELSIEDGRRAAQAALLNALSVLEHHTGLDRIERIIKLTGYVQTEPDFFEIPKVINGASDLLVALWAEKGKHARSAIGACSLPLNVAVELELTVLLKEVEAGRGT